MSIEATSWALNVPVGGTMKVLLLGIANHAHPDGTRAFPAVDTLARYAHCDRRTVQRNLRALEAEGWIKPDGSGPTGTACWCLPLGRGGGILPPQPQEGAASTVGGGGIPVPGGAALAPPEPYLTFNEPDEVVVNANVARGRERTPPPLPVAEGWGRCYDVACGLA